MKKAMKGVVLATMPAVCGVLGVSAYGEKINWPERPSAEQPFPAVTRVAAGGQAVEGKINVGPEWLPELNRQPVQGLVVPGDVFIVNGRRE